MNTQTDQKITLEEFARLAGDVYPLAQSLACELLRYHHYGSRGEAEWRDTPQGWEKRLRFAFNHVLPEEEFDALETQVLMGLYLKFGGSKNKRLEN